MRTEALHSLEAERLQPLPFVMLFAEEAQMIPITGQYNEKAQVWEGMAVENFANVPTSTCTSTQTPYGGDTDQDSDWVDIPL